MTGGPYRTAGVPMSAQPDPDPLHLWHILNAGWAIEEMEWSDKAQAPSVVAWRSGEMTLRLATRGPSMVEVLGSGDPRVAAFIKGRLVPVHVTTAAGRLWLFEGDSVIRATFGVAGTGAAGPTKIDHKLGLAIEAEVANFLALELSR